MITFNNQGPVFNNNVIINGDVIVGSIKGNLEIIKFYPIACLTSEQ